jgi:hypothetical protein
MGEAFLVTGATKKRPDYLLSTAPRDTIHKLHLDSEELKSIAKRNATYAAGAQRDRPSLQTQYPKFSNSNLVAMQLRDLV